MWVDVRTFAIDEDADDRTLLVQLVASPGYAHSYARPFDATEGVLEPAIHGPYWRSSISADLFEPITVAEAEAVLLDWASNQEWSDPDYRQPEDALARLNRVCERLGRGALFRLANPGVEHWHDWGGVVGRLGFHEFVVLDHDSRVVDLIVAADD